MELLERVAEGPQVELVLDPLSRGLAGVGAQVGVPEVGQPDLFAGRGVGRGDGRVGAVVLEGNEAADADSEVSVELSAGPSVESAAPSLAPLWSGQALLFHLSQNLNALLQQP